MKLTVSRTDRVSVPVYCFKIADMLEATYTESEVPQDVGEVEKAIFTFRRPGHSDSQSIFKQCNFQPNLTGEGDATFNVSDLQDVILRVLLVEWSLTDDNDKKLPLTTGNVNSLHPAVARAAAAGCLDQIRL